MPTFVHTSLFTPSAPCSCRACGEGEPEASILLCDGCDDAYHMQCLRPAIKAVPEGTWFCHKCEQDVQVGGEMLGGGSRQGEGRHAGGKGGGAAGGSEEAARGERLPASPGLAVGAP